MIDLMEEILNALRGDEQLVELLCGNYIWEIEAVYPDQFPRITVFEIDNDDANYAEDAPTAARLYYQVDIWDTKPRRDLAHVVDVIMKTLGFFRISAQILYENDTKIVHHALKYTITQSLEE